MAVTAWKEIVSPVLWRVYFTSTIAGATFYVWLDGALFGATTAGYMDVPVGLGQVAQVDVFDTAGESPDATYPATVTLRWEVGDGVALSRIEQYVDGAWVVRGQVPATGSGAGRWESAPLADATAYQFRVVPVDGTGRDSAVPRLFSGVMCRWPDAPSVSVAVSSGEFLIEAA